MLAQDFYIQISNLHDYDLANYLKKALSHAQGVELLAVDFSRHRMRIRLNHQCSISQLKRLLKQHGAHVVRVEIADVDRSLDRSLINIILFVYAILSIVSHIFISQVTFWSVYQFWIICLAMSLVHLFLSIAFLNNTRVYRVGYAPISRWRAAAKYLHILVFATLILIAGALWRQQMHLLTILLTLLPILLWQLWLVSLLFYRSWHLRFKANTQYWQQFHQHQLMSNPLYNDQQAATSPMLISCGETFTINKPGYLALDALSLAPIVGCNQQQLVQRYAGEYINTPYLGNYRVTATSNQSVFVKMMHKARAQTLQKDLSASVDRFKGAACYIGIAVLFLFVAALSFWPFSAFSWQAVVLLGNLMYLLSYNGAFWWLFLDYIKRLRLLRLSWQANIFTSNQLLAKLAKLRSIAIIHQGVFDLELNYSSAHIKHTQLVHEDAADIWQAYQAYLQGKVVESLRPIRFEQRADEQVVVYVDEREFVIVTDSWLKRQPKSAESALLKSYLEEEQGFWRKSFFLLEQQQCVSVLALRYQFGEQMTKLVAKLQEQGFEVIIISELHQRLVNELAREVGVLQAYGSCDTACVHKMLKRWYKEFGCLLYFSNHQWLAKELPNDQAREHIWVSEFASSQQILMSADMVVPRFEADDIGWFLAGWQRKERRFWRALMVWVLPLILLVLVGLWAGLRGFVFWQAASFAQKFTMMSVAIPFVHFAVASCVYLCSFLPRKKLKLSDS